MNRIFLSAEVVDLLWWNWNHSRSTPTDIDLFTHYRKLGWDLQYGCGNGYSLPNDQVTFFLLKYAS